MTSTHIFRRTCFQMGCVGACMWRVCVCVYAVVNLCSFCRPLFSCIWFLPKNLTASLWSVGAKLRNDGTNEHWTKRWKTTLCLNIQMGAVWVRGQYNRPLCCCVNPWIDLTVTQFRSVTLGYLRPGLEMRPWEQYDRVLLKEFWNWLSLVRAR